MCTWLKEVYKWVWHASPDTTITLIIPRKRDHFKGKINPGQVIVGSPGVMSDWGFIDLRLTLDNYLNRLINLNTDQTGTNGLKFCACVECHSLVIWLKKKSIRVTQPDPNTNSWKCVAFSQIEILCSVSLSNAFVRGTRGMSLAALGFNSARDLVLKRCFFFRMVLEAI